MPVLDIAVGPVLNRLGMAARTVLCAVWPSVLWEQLLNNHSLQDRLSWMSLSGHPDHVQLVAKATRALCSPHHRALLTPSMSQIGSAE